MSGSYLGPPADAAQMCAATPVLEVLIPSEEGPIVTASQPGREQRNATRFASLSMSGLLNSSRAISVHVLSSCTLNNTLLHQQHLNLLAFYSIGYKRRQDLASLASNAQQSAECSVHDSGKNT